MNIDKLIGENEFLLSFFKNINPNYITLTGIVLNFIIYYYIKNNNIFNANILLLLRYFCDTMDGSVARKYNKTSEIGGFLDTLDDFFIFLIYSYIILYNYIENKQLVLIITVILSLSFIYYMKDSLSDHSNLKENGKNIFDKIMIFQINNNIFIYLLLIIFNTYYLKKIDK